MGVRYQPDWVDLRSYRARMRDTMGREWNLLTEYHDTIQPDMDIPAGYQVQPTTKEDGKEPEDNYKTSFGKKGKKKRTTKLYSVYGNQNVSDGDRRRKVDRGPEKQRA